MTADKEKQEITPKEGFDEGRRDFLKVAITASAVLAFGGVATVLKAISNPAASATAGTARTFPKVLVANANDLKTNQPVFFNYPLDNEPNILVKIGQKTPGGIGPDGDIVAFSQICQHLGCPVAYLTTGTSPSCGKYSASGPVAYCCCHGSVFDLLQNAKVIAGPAPRPVPLVQLELDSLSGNIYATGMSPPVIFGHDTGNGDVSGDLQGGNLVG